MEQRHERGSNAACSEACPGKKYSEAINVLAAIVKSQPERLDEVEKMMAVIRSARAQYNSNYAELINILKKKHLPMQM